MADSRSRERVVRFLLNKIGSLCITLITLCVRAYQVVISPHLGNCCRFEPSCSAYCIEALKVHGLFKGLWLTLKRVVRCRPFGKFGFDPVPLREKPEEVQAVLKVNKDCVVKS